MTFSHQHREMKMLTVRINPYTASLFLLGTTAFLREQTSSVFITILSLSGIWKPYDPLITRLVEKQRRKVAVVKLREVDAKMCNIVIDFKAMQQIRYEPHFHPRQRRLFS